MANGTRLRKRAIFVEMGEVLHETLFLPRPVAQRFLVSGGSEMKSLIVLGFQRTVSSMGFGLIDFLTEGFCG